MNYVLPLIYAIIFSWLILKLRFFKESGIKPAVRLGIFWLKILTGIFVIYIYTHFYKNPSTSDVLLYYKDGKIMFNALTTNPGDFFKMFFGIGCDTEYFNQVYFTRMERWQRMHDSLFINDCRTIIRFNAFFDLFAFGAFHANTVMMCFLSFSGLTALYRALQKYFPSKQTLLLCAVFLAPALLFWSSSILKEGILTFCMGFFIYAFLQIFIEKNRSFGIFTTFILSLLLFSVNKVYILLTIFPPLFCFALFTKINFRFKWFAFLIVHLLMIIGGLFFFKKVLKKDLAAEIITKQRDFINVAKGGLYLVRDSIIVRMEYSEKAQLIPTQKKDTVLIKEGSKYDYWIHERLYDTLRKTNSGKDSTEYFLMHQIEPARSTYYMPHLKPELSSFLNYAPKAFVNVLLRPWFTEAENLYQKACSAENIFYLVVMLLCLILGNYKNANWALFWMGIFFCINLFLIIGFTTPIAGALVRYKAPALPFLLMSAFSLLNVEKLKRIPLLKHLVGE